MSQIAVISFYRKSWRLFLTTPYAQKRKLDSAKLDFEQNVGVYRMLTS